MSALVLEVETSKAPLLTSDAWREDLASRLEAGTRLLTLFAREDGAQHSLVTAVFLDADGTPSVSRSRMVTAHGYHELTSTFPALHCFEREMHEQTGLRIAGHPWLKPIRFERAPRGAMNAFPWYQVHGKEVHEVAVGPIHAGVIEPGAFRFMCLGEQVHHLEIHLGYQHRGVEARLLEGDPRRLGPLVETIAGDTSVAHAWAWAAALERLGGVVVEPRAELVRAAMLELERAAMHLAGLAGLATDVGFLQGASTWGRLRTTAINTSMRLCGSRFGRGAVRAGGVAVQLATAREAALQGVKLLQDDLAIINPHFLGARTVVHRLSGAGVVSRPDALALGLVGMAARASGVAVDTRQVAGGVWRTQPLKMVVREEGDCLARARVRIEELDASLAWLAAALQTLDVAPARQEVGALLPERLVVAVVEGWRGEVVHAIETGADAKLRHYKVQDPSLRNWMGLARAVRDNEISDFPICNKSFDLSYCGNDL